jgi:hypothetical protein
MAATVESGQLRTLPSRKPRSRIDRMPRILPPNLLQPRLHSRVLRISGHRSLLSAATSSRFLRRPPWPIEALLTVQFCRERRGPQPDIRALLLRLLDPAPLSWNIFLPTSSGLPPNCSSPFRNKPFISALIEAVTGAEPTTHIYARNAMEKAPAWESFVLGVQKNTS